MRLFAALPLPPPAIDRLTSLRLRLATPHDGLRWSPPEQWHLTLQFYGELAPELAARLRTALEAATLPAPHLTLEALDLFPTKGILYAAITPSPTLAQLHNAIVTAGLTPASEAPRPFHPHVTLARSRGRPGDEALRALATPTLPAFGPPIHWLATECLLLESTLTPQGARSATQARIPLAGP